MYADAPIIGEPDLLDLDRPEQLVGGGRSGPDAKRVDDLVVDAPPIYLQEQIDLRVLIESLQT